MKIILSEQMYISTYKRIQKEENEARDMGGTLTGGRSIAEFLKKRAVYTSQNQAEAIYDGVMEKWNGLTPAEKRQIVLRNPALSILETQNRPLIIERLRKEDHNDPGSLRAQLFKYYPGSPDYVKNNAFYWSPKSP
jgi:hypothetical protein